MIEPQEIFKKIGFILNDLQDQYDYLSHHTDRINPAELQLMQANADFLADHIRIYKSLFDQQLQSDLPKGDIKADLKVLPELDAESEHSVGLEEESPIVDSNTHLDKPTFEFILGDEMGAEEATFEFEKGSVDQIFDRVLTEEEEEILNRAKDKFEVVEPSDDIADQSEASMQFGTEVQQNSIVEAPLDVEEEEEGPEPFILEVPTTDASAEIPKSDIPVQNLEQAKKPNINELLASASGVRTPEAAPIADLKQAINLNDKLLFIRDLFNGYNLAYSEAIDVINKMDDLASADAFLKKTYAEKNLWADKEASVNRFYEFLSRRFQK